LCKTHKKQGEVEHRNVHAAPSYCFAGLGKWLEFVLQTELNKFRHLVMSTNDFVERVQSIHMDEMSFMARIDAKHFYMSGTIHQLIESSVQIIPDPKTKEFAIRVAFFLLHNQFIQSSHCPHRIWRVVRGSGQGLGHSGAIADAAFFICVERRWTLSSRVCDAFGILSYLRFKDDIWIAGNKPLGYGKYMAGMHKRVHGFFKLETVELSCHRVDMLACTVVREGNRCHTVPRNKGFLGPPLSAESAHPWHVHKAWPSATLKTQLLLCSKESEKVLHKQQYIERFVQHHSPPWLIATLHDVAIGVHRAVKRQVEKKQSGVL
jgi:hypothetical protein